MNIQEKLKKVTQYVNPTLTYMYDDWNRFNKRISKLEKADTVEVLGVAKLPGVFVLLQASGRFHLKNGNLRDYPDLQIVFLRDALKDFDGLCNDTLIEEMKSLAIEWVLAYNTSGLFEPLPEDIFYSPIYEMLADRVTGVMLSIRAEELIGGCWRLPEPEEPEENVDD